MYILCINEKIRGIHYRNHRPETTKYIFLQIILKTAKFLQPFSASKNTLCLLFKHCAVTHHATQ